MPTHSGGSHPTIQDDTYIPHSDIDIILSCTLGSFYLVSALLGTSLYKSLGSVDRTNTLPGRFTLSLTIICYLRVFFWDSISFIKYPPGLFYILWTFPGDLYFTTGSALAAYWLGIYVSIKENKLIDSRPLFKWVLRGNIIFWFLQVILFIIVFVDPTAFLNIQVVFFSLCSLCLSTVFFWYGRKIHLAGKSITNTREMQAAQLPFVSFATLTVIISFVIRSIIDLLWHFIVTPLKNQRFFIFALIFYFFVEIVPTVAILVMVRRKVLSPKSPFVRGLGFTDFTRTKTKVSSDVFDNDVVQNSLDYKRNALIYDVQQGSYVNSNIFDESRFIVEEIDHSKIGPIPEKNSSIKIQSNPSVSTSASGDSNPNFGKNIPRKQSLSTHFTKGSQTSSTSQNTSYSPPSVLDRKSSGFLTSVALTPPNDPSFVDSISIPAPDLSDTIPPPLESPVNSYSEEFSLPMSRNNSTWNTPSWILPTSPIVSEETQSDSEIHVSETSGLLNRLTEILCPDLTPGDLGVFFVEPVDESRSNSKIITDFKAPLIGSDEERSL